MRLHAFAQELVLQLPGARRLAAFAQQLRQQLRAQGQQQEAHDEGEAPFGKLAARQQEQGARSERDQGAAAAAGQAAPQGDQVQQQARCQARQKHQPAARVEMRGQRAGQRNARQQHRRRQRPAGQAVRRIEIQGQQGGKQPGQGADGIQARQVPGIGVAGDAAPELHHQQQRRHQAQRGKHGPVPLPLVQRAQGQEQQGDGAQRPGQQQRRQPVPGQCRAVVLPVDQVQRIKGRRQARRRLLRRQQQAQVVFACGQLLRPQVDGEIDVARAFPASLAGRLAIAADQAAIEPQLAGSERRQHQQLRRRRRGGQDQFALDAQLPARQEQLLQRGGGRRRHAAASAPALVQR